MILENSFLKVEIAAKGAELRSITTIDNQEILWQRDPAFWSKTSPILFPNIGELKDKKYQYNGKTYPMERHGFAKDMNFTVEKIANDKAVFTLTQNEESLKIYPFHFVLEVTYELIESELFCSYKITNPVTELLYFSIGGHPAFAVGNDKIPFESHYLLFEDDKQLDRLHLDNGLVVDATETIPLDKNKLQLTWNLFKNNALIFCNLKSKQIKLKNTVNQDELTFSFSNFTHFGIWTVPNAHYVCLEPWCGIADSVDSNQNFIEKEGIITLQKDKTFECSWSVRIDV